jgi:hypothetical protein
MPMITIQRRAFDETIMNSTNHPKDPADLEVRDLDYKTEIRKTNLKYWRTLIDYPVKFEWTFTTEEVKHFQAAMPISLISREFSSLHSEEMEAAVKRLETELIDSRTGWFVRFDSASPKDGKRSWPLLTASEVIEQVVTSERALRALEDGNRTLYFCYYVPRWDPQREVRVFVYKGKVTGISQYPIRSDYFRTFSDDGLKFIAGGIVSLIEKGMPEMILALNTENFVCDVYVEDHGFGGIIEFNSFGYWLASGSSYFHWMLDKSILYNREGKVVFRVSV